MSKFPPKKNVTTTSATVSPLFRFPVGQVTQSKVRKLESEGKNCGNCIHYTRARCKARANKRVMPFSICHIHNQEILK